MENRFQRNRGVDMISALPECLILEILSDLPTKIVISTSALSKKWRSLWKSVPHLKFDSEEHQTEQQTFVEIVSKSMFSHKAPTLESFKLVFDLHEVTPVDIGVWVGIALARNLRQLILDFQPLDETFTFSSCFCCCDTLETLKLRFLFLDVSTPVLMKSLTTLHFIDVHYQDEASIRNVLSGCPILEEFLMVRGDGSYIETFTIEVPSLQRLTIRDDNDDGDGFSGYVITTPSLTHLHIQMLRCEGFDLVAPELVEARIADSCILNDNFLGSFTSVKRLSLNLSPSEITYPPTGTIFSHLEFLEIYTREHEWWDLLTCMLENSPKLQVLKLVDLNLHLPKNGVVGDKWIEPKSVPECLLSCLETFVWTRYDWKREEEKEVATYILGNARKLKKATFSTNSVRSEELNELKERLNELDGVVRASNSCHFVLNTS